MSRGRLHEPGPIARAIRLHQAGRLPEAEAIYRRILSEMPDQPDALHYLGVIRHQQGDGDAAVSLIRKSLAHAPDYLDAHNNLGNVLKERGRFEEAAAAYREVLARDPRHAAALGNLGVALKELGRYDEAIDALKRAVHLAPDSADAHLNLANVHRKRGEVDEAVAAYRRAIELRPVHAEAHRNLCRMLHRTGRHDEAVSLLEQWRESDPENPIAVHLLAAISGRERPDRASDDFVRETFDRCATTFDEVLERLGYRAPSLVADAVEAELGTPAGEIDVLDAGCGTGLCGPFLRPHARRLVGVDLSGAMMARARGRGYDELVEAELTAYLREAPSSFDLVVSADTLVYFGALEDVAAATAASLRPGGRLIFTVEHLADEVEDDFRLHPHGRYAHTEDYVRRVLGAAGLTVTSVSGAVLRQEADEPVVGLVVVARARSG